jgi:hypothetical protein
MVSAGRAPRFLSLLHRALGGNGPDGAPIAVGETARIRRSAEAGRVHTGLGRGLGDPRSRELCPSRCSVGTSRRRLASGPLLHASAVSHSVRLCAGCRDVAPFSRARGPPTLSPSTRTRDGEPRFPRALPTRPREKLGLGPNGRIPANLPALRRTRGCVPSPLGASPPCTPTPRAGFSAPARFLENERCVSLSPAS